MICNHYYSDKILTKQDIATTLLLDYVMHLSTKIRQLRCKKEAA